MLRRGGLLAPLLVGAACLLQQPAVAAGAPSLTCPAATTQTDAFSINGTAYLACEDLASPGGGLALVSADGAAEWFSKTSKTRNSVFKMTNFAKV